ncbi:LiaF transmembrane domain-containing protein [Gudongella sp. DL1XJH-153]|uniref:LiaF transmembrane domain-containing protein n=1 Tax=Gudongella sp. DL1XJH-153 TaxID=3409804 RepID=UPI003BB525EE
MKGRYLLGIILIVVGAGFLMDQFGMVSFGELVSTYWPSILILAGLLGLLDRNSSSFGNIIVIAIGVIFQLNRLDMLDGDVFRYIFPVILIFVGLNLLITKGGRREYHEYHSDSEYTESSKASEKGNWAETSEDFMDRTVLMSGLDTINSSQNFKGARLTAIMGGIEIDLSGAKMAGDHCEIEATAIAGGIDITVPRTWKVEMRGTPILGGYSNRTGVVDDPLAPVLIVKGAAIMGGVEIKW